MQDSEDLEAQLASKEREWKELQALRIQQLETALSEATSELSTQGEHFLRLRDDFQYNLRVLEERDRELERYDAMAVRVQTEDSARQTELSELRIQLAKLQDALGEGKKQYEDLQAQYQKRGVEHRIQMERVYSLKEGEIQTLREENETLRRDLQLRIQASDGELALQKQEMLADFDSEMRKREHEFTLRLDEMRNVVLSHELKVQLLNKELDVHAKGRNEAVEALQLSEHLCQQAQKEILQRDWDLRNTSAVKDSKIQELEEKMTQMKAKHKKEEEVSNRKHAELERRVREREMALEAMKEAHVSDLQEEKKKATHVQMQLDSLILEQERRDKKHADEMSHREQQIQELFAQLEKTQASWDAYITQVSKETVAKDTELLSALDRQAKIRAELEKCKEDSERYKQQLANAAQREQALEQKRVQLELDWERRCEDVRAEHYLRSEELIHGLTQSREKVNAELMEKEQELQETVALLRSVTIERDQALRGLTSNTASQVIGVESSSFPSEEIRRLQQQNSSLREVVTEMRRQMETLSTEVALPQNPMTTQHSDPIPSSTAGGLRAEKVASAAALKKQEVRLAHLESIVTQLTQQCQSRQMENEALRLELANQKRGAAAEEASLKQRLTAAEMQLEEVKREAEEYQKGSILHNLQTVALGNQVSALKLDIASRREPIILTQSEMVKQLQEENLSLRQQLLLQGTGRGHDLGSPRQLQTKLKQAARLISRLSQDKQQLIEMGNRLRAQLIESGLDDLQHSETRSKPSLCEKETSKDESDAQPHGRLSALEQLQYKLTNQELQYAQRDQSKKNPVTIRPLSGSGASDTNPWDLPTRVRVQHGFSKENTPPVHSQSKGPVHQANSPQTLLSSVGTDESLQDVWKMLEHGLSPTMLTPSNSEDQARAEEHRNTPRPGLPVRVQGLKAAIQERKKQARTTSEHGKKARPAGKAINIRNYNIKD
ncbi:coiled-coil domain-containing protein 57 isoform X2 [Ictalurus furcatus]|uniref:coiled-coil domain-containing protein 57 isoform X2 n=1 Tax=Ictalurus furcatus TaxID=66913 RepID=UPI00234FFCF7|nr:coiled-coil domain-containing protein 57 isoform X2 [Ictalurus furcatus]